MRHTFAIPVYRHAPQLGALLVSLRAQVGPASTILLTTSTPSAELTSFARREAVPLLVNPKRIDIATDWNFALCAAETPLVTLAHQDDVFAPSYVHELVAAFDRHPTALLAFSDYSEHTPAGPRPCNINLRIKRILSRRVFRGRESLVNSRDKIRLLSLGNPICCPSVMLHRRNTADFRFVGGLQTNLDWMAWLELARRPGAFIYVPQQLVSKGIHAGSETSATIANKARAREDRDAFCEFWPRPMATMLATLYKLGYRANRTAS